MNSSLLLQHCPACLVRLILIVFLMGGRWPYSCCFVGCCLQDSLSRRYPAKTITDADYAGDIALLTNTPPQTETLLLSLEWAAVGIGFHVNAHKTEHMCFNQTGDFSTLNGSSLKLVVKFTYLGSSVSLTETDINTRLAKVWAAIHRLSVIWQSDLTDKMKRSFFQAAVVSILLYGCTTRTLTKKRKGLTATTQECCEQYWTSSGGNTPQSSSIE